MSIDTLRAIIDEWDLRAKRNADTIAALKLRIAELEGDLPPDPDPEPEPEPEPGDLEPLPATVTTMTGEVIPVPGRLGDARKGGE